MVCAELNDEAVLLNIDTGIYFGLEGVGARTWKLLQMEKNEDEILSTLLADYDVNPDQLRRDLASFFKQLEKHGLVVARTG